MRDEGDDTSSGNVSCAADSHDSRDRDRNMPSDVDPVPPLEFVQATRPVSDVAAPPSADNHPAIPSLHHRYIIPETVFNIRDLAKHLSIHGAVLYQLTIIL